MHVRLSTVLAIGMLSLAMVASAADIEKKYGVELRGGFGTITMDDVNNLADTLWGSGLTTATKPSGTPLYGVSILYRSHPEFLWEIGYNAFPLASWESKNRATGRVARMDISGSEIYILPTYVWGKPNGLTLGIGAGPDLSFAVASRSGHTTDALNFSNANGRTVGGMVKAFVELAMGKHNGVIVSAGYRNHYIDRIRKEADSGGNREAIVIPNTTQYLPVDYSGAFVQIGWRFYYEPKPWRFE